MALTASMRDTISEAYREQNRALHRNRDYGAYGDKHRKIASRYHTGTALDYGCGKATLDLPGIKRYDPAIKGMDKAPEPADLVVCTDVLEHVEPEFLDNVLDDLRRVTKDVLLVAVSTKPAKKVLPDGRNAHLIVKPAEWWEAKLAERFHVERVEGLFVCR